MAPKLSRSPRSALGRRTKPAQALTITVSTDHPEFFDIAGEPSVAADGTLTFTPATGAFGTANVTVTAQDDGGTANGGQDTGSISFQIVIAPLPPNAGDDSYTTTVFTLLHVPAPGVLQNDADVNSTTLTVTPATVTTALGSVTINADGSFDYQPGAVPGRTIRSATRSPTALDNGDRHVTISVTAIAATTARCTSLRAVTRPRSGISRRPHPRRYRRFPTLTATGTPG